MPDTTQPLAIVTGASSGIGLELARLAAQQGYDLVIAADESEVPNVADTLEANGVQVRAVEGSINYPP